MSMKDKYNKNPMESPKPKGNRDIMGKIMTEKNPVNTGIQETVNEPLSSKKATKKATFELNSELHKRLRLAAIKKDTSMLQLVENALVEYLNKIDC